MNLSPGSYSRLELVITGVSRVATLLSQVLGSVYPRRDSVAWVETVARCPPSKRTVTSGSPPRRLHYFP